MEHQQNAFQNKFQNLQNKFQTTVQGLNNNIRQQLEQRSKLRQPGNDAAGPDDEDNCIKIPVESAKQLRWYDRADLKLLLKVHLAEKHQLYLANAALREALSDTSGVSASTNVSYFNKEIDRMVRKDAALSEFLVVAAGLELDTLRNRLASIGDTPDQDNETTQIQVSDEKQQLETLLSTAQEAQYQAECARATAEEKLEKFQLLSSTQQAELDDLKTGSELKSNEIRKLQARLEVMERELRESISQTKVQAAQSKVSSKVSDLTRENTKLNDLIRTEVEKNKKLDLKLQASDIALAKALAQIADLETIVSERDELQARVAFYEASMSDMKAKHVSEDGLRERLDETVQQLKAAQDELLSTAKIAASLELDLQNANRELVQRNLDHNSLQEPSRNNIEHDGDDRGDGQRSTWPHLALEELDMAQMRIRTLQMSNQTCTNELKDCHKELDLLRGRLRENEAAIMELQTSKQDLERFSAAQIDRLESTMLVTSQKMDELRSKNISLQRKLLHWEETGAASQNEEAGEMHATADTERLYAKNVILKFVQCLLQGKLQECDVLLPAIKTVLRVSPVEYKRLKKQVEDAQSFFSWIT